MKTDLFQSCGHCWVSQICWHIECSTFTASSLRIWNNSIGIPATPLALFIVMLPKAHLTSHSRMSGSRWVITLSWLSGSWRSFLYSSFVYSCHLFLISSASVRSTPFLSFIVPIFAWNVPLVSLTFLKRSLVFPILLFPSISLHLSLFSHIYRCESCTTEKAECWRIDAFELWSWRRLKNPLDSKEIKPVNPKGNQSWIFIESTDVEAPTLQPPDTKCSLFWKDPDAGKD